MSDLVLVPGSASLTDLERIWRDRVAVRLDPDNREELDYYLLPWLDLPRQEIRLCNRTSIAFEAFRFEDLGFFYGMAERVGIRRKWG